VQGEVVAAACERIAREEPTEGMRVPAVRTVTLLALLERRFGCEVGRGKGSEVTVWRPGGRKFTLGHHHRNTHVPAHVVRALLEAVGNGAWDGGGDRAGLTTPTGSPSAPAPAPPPPAPPR